MHATQDLHDVLIVLAAAILVVPIFQRLRSSPVLGYLVAGMLIGPAGLAIVSDVSGMTVLANFGVVFLLFTIGLELSIERLKAIRFHVFGLGTLQVVVTAALFYFAARWLGQPREAAAILAGGLALSSTAIVLQILVERGELPTRHGRVSFAILLLQDLAVVPLLTLVPLLAGGGTRLAGALGIAALKAVAALLVILVVGRLILRPALRAVAAAKSPELFTGVTLLVVLSVSYLTEVAGLSMALGAFLAGLLIAETEYRHQVEGDIEPFRGILLALFFMTVGMTIDLGLVVREAPLVLSLVAGLVLGKAVVLTVLCRSFGFPTAVSAQVGLSLGQGGEFAFVLFSLAMALGVLGGQVGQLMLAVVALTMALTPFLMVAGRWIGSLLSPRVGPAELHRLEEDARDFKGHVIIAGFGRVGQTIARLLEAQRLPYMAFDLEPSRVAEGRARGLPIYYGDASRAEVLKAAGVNRARAAVVTLDQPHAAERAVEAIRRLSPLLDIHARARDHEHQKLLHDAGANHVVPEMVEGSLRLGGLLLRSLGRSSGEIAEQLEEFRGEAYAKLTNLIPPQTDRQRSAPSKDGKTPQGECGHFQGRENG
ncbi:monovalent cation:proton antiporter-2 (CPA2) family protein [Skermanella rosea]|uniref:monovalent cation:proton antiporter-2 (CPA2) family protein n=1 Tax=Skermanella rosea TaxID=1817965 RepID=UPI00193241AD|nr:monovalent cation:proton antiporter-2 (CPA2) family protein [Skermanella rosea]UEM05698.1 monovalent cation:proton antiporter-2 (CPA2) family protein [Skermanella rosea]